MTKRRARCEGTGLIERQKKPRARFKRSAPARVNGAHFVHLKRQSASTQFVSFSTVITIITAAYAASTMNITHTQSFHLPNIINILPHSTTSSDTNSITKIIYNLNQSYYYLE